MYTVAYDRDVLKWFDKIPKEDYWRISKKLDQLALDPYSEFLDVKKMSTSEKLYRIRVGDYRVKYKLKDDILLIYVIEAGHRKDVYR